MGISSDPKTFIQEVLYKVINAHPRTRSGRGWFISSNATPVFIQLVLERIFESGALSGVHTSYYFNSKIYQVFAGKRFVSNQQYVEAMLVIFNISAALEIAQLLEKIIYDLPRAGWVHRRIPDGTAKKRFAEAVVDELYRKDSKFIIDTEENITKFLCDTLGETKNIKSLSGRVDAILDAFFHNYKKRG